MRTTSCLFFLLAFAVFGKAQGISDREVLRFIVEENYEYRNFQMTPQFPGDRYAIETYIKEEFINPYPAIPDTVYYHAIAHFEIDYFGIPINVRIVQSISSWKEEIACLDEEVYRLFYEMPPWYPGENNGAPAKMQYKQAVFVTLYPHVNGEY